MFQIEGTACAEGLWPLGVSDLKEGLTGRGSDGEMRQRGKHRPDNEKDNEKPSKGSR